MRTAVPIAFVIFLGLWTWKLLEPHPVPESISQELPLDLAFILAKTLHAGAYASLTILAAFLPVRRRLLWAVVGVLALHGVGTEIGQTYVPNRHGCVRDVLIDWTGIGMGLLFLWLGSSQWFHPWKRNLPEKKCHLPSSLL